MPQIPAGGRVTFFEVLRRTRYKYLLALSLALLLAGITLVSVLSSRSPTEFEGTAQSFSSDLEVKDSSEGPAILTVSYTFHLRVDGIFYEVVDGPSSVDFTARVISAGGREIYNWTTTLGVPWTIMSPEGSLYTDTDTTELELPVGKYTFMLSSEHPVEYKLHQGNKLELALYSAGVLAGVGVILIAIAVVLARNAQASLNTSRVLAAMSVPASGAIYDPRPPAMYGGGYPGSYPAHSLSGVDREAFEHVCARCGNVIRNPVVLGVITCERCGEKEYVG